MPPRGAFAITITNEEHAVILLWALRYGINSWFSVEEEERNIASYYADQLEKNIEDRKARERNHKMHMALATTKTMDEARAILGRKPMTPDEERARNDAAAAETMRQLDAMRDSDEHDGLDPD
jgi:hypothetical protein